MNLKKSVTGMCMEAQQIEMDAITQWTLHNDQRHGFISVTMHFYCSKL